MLVTIYLLKETYFMRKTKNLKTFKDFCNSYYCQDYIRKYINNMTSVDFEQFYFEVKRAASFLIDEDYLFYKMFWILKYPFNNLCVELLNELCANLEGYDLSKIITNDKFDELMSLYATSLLEDILPL